VPVPAGHLREALPHAGDAEREIAGSHDRYRHGAGHDQGDLHVCRHELQDVVVRDAQLGDVGDVDQRMVELPQSLGRTQERSLRLENLLSGEHARADKLQPSPAAQELNGERHAVALM